VLVGAALAGYLSLRRPAARLRRRRLAATTMIEAAS
jgi:hypothetical protein